MRSDWILGSCVVAIFAAAGSAQTLDLIDQGLLPGDAGIVAAPNNQSSHVVARGGDQYLVVWADRRAQQTTSVAPQSRGDIYAMRLNAQGEPIDHVPFIVGAAFGEQSQPKVAWNGENWLVVFISQDPDNGYFADRIRAVRVSPLGEILDPTPISFPATQFTPDTIGLQVAGLGSQWIVTRCVYHSDGYGTFLGGQRISGAGALLDSSPVMLMDWTYGPCTTIATQTEFLVAGPDWSNSATIKARRVSGAMSPIGAAFNVPSRSIASNGTEYYVAWTSGGNLVGSRMTSGGTLVSPAGTVLATGASPGHTTVSHDDVNWWVEWGAAAELRTMRVSPSGAALDPLGGAMLPIVIGGTSGFAYDPVVVGRAGGGATVFWNDSRAAMSSDTNVYSLTIDASNAPIQERVVSTSSPNQRTADLATGPGDQTACVFVSEAADVDRVLVQFLDGNGVATRAEPIEVFRGVNVGRAKIAWNGSVYMIAFDAGLTGPNIYTVRMAADGTLIDTPVPSMTGFSPDVEALGGNFLVAMCRYGFTPQTIYAVARRFDGVTGATLDSGELLLGGTYVSAGPRVRTDGTRWIVTYHSNWTHNSTQSDVAFNFVNADGTFTTAVNPSTSSGAAGHPDVAFSGSEYLFVWRNNTLATPNNFISGRIMHADGTYAPNVITIAEAPGRQLTPAVTWDGANFVVAWEDQRQQAAFFDDRTDVYAAIVSEQGVVQTPGAMAIKIDEHGVVEPALASRNGVTYVATSRMMSTETLDSYRIGVNVLGAPACPPCAADFDQNGGVDGGDLGAFFAEFEQGAACADVDANGGIDGGDLAAFFGLFEAGGCS